MLQKIFQNSENFKSFFHMCAKNQSTNLCPKFYPSHDTNYVGLFNNSNRSIVNVSAMQY